MLEIRSVDNQHKKFFETINNLYYLIEKKKINKVKKSSLKEYIKDMETYVNSHLSYEEECFDKYAYIEKDAHLADHDLFRHKVRMFIDRAEENEKEIDNISLEMADFAKDWLSDHILNIDRKYISFFIKNDID